MPKNAVTDPITDQEITFAHLLLSGTMNDREAAEAAGLNPTTAAYTKSKPRVREYMDQYRAAVKEKMVAEEAEALRNLTLIREQFLDRLWELARLSPAETRGSIAGQIKAMTMIGAVLGLLPSRLNDRCPSANPGQPESPAVKAQMYVAEWRRKHQDDIPDPTDSVTATETQPDTAPLPESPGAPANNAPSVNEEDNPFTYPKGVSWVPNAIGPSLDAYPNTTNSLRSPFSPGKGALVVAVEVCKVQNYRILSNLIRVGHFSEKKRTCLEKIARLWQEDILAAHLIR